MQGKPSIRDPQPCGTKEAPSSGREPSQLGWYQFVATKLCKDDSVLDVGSGMGAGIAYMNFLGAECVRGFDTDTRLRHIPKTTIDFSPLLAFGAKSWDVVTCMDVIEHVVDDINLFQELIQIARQAVYISTPNFSRSGAVNHHHCREYTISEFVNIFQPNQLWVGSPDGWYHRQMLLEKRGLGWPTTTPAPLGQTGAYRYVIPLTGETFTPGHLPLDKVWSEGSVDGLEWPHFCGVFFPGR